MYSMPVFDMIEAAFRAWGWTRNKLITRLLMRTLYVAFTCFVAVTLPFFGGNDRWRLSAYPLLCAFPSQEKGYAQNNTKIQSSCLY